MKLITLKINRLYELTFLIPSVYTDSELLNFKKEVEDLIKKYKGKVKASDDWGKKNLAYSIKKAGKIYTEAFYFHYQIEFPAKKVQEFEKFLYMNHNIIRHLLVLSEEKVDTKTAAKSEKKEAKQ